MNITRTLHYPDCQSTKIKKNGKKASGKQNYLCKNLSSTKTQVIRFRTDNLLQNAALIRSQTLVCYNILFV
ncbi:hypothetical protein EZS27_022809 [termite gut metagenome]|uniref:InsA N-terminal domain-containing protein n=1 Tax=termite gut metagenome TaxID=433724 RepID=A0A5J4R4R6_9ZZZZ